MIPFLARRLVLALIVLALINFLAFAYAVVGRWVQESKNPFLAATSGPPDILPLYGEYAHDIFQNDFGPMPTAQGLTIGRSVGDALSNSLGLLAIAFTLSLIIGLGLGLRAVRTSPPAVAGWLTPIATIGMAMPSFYIGGLLIAGSIYYLFLNLGDRLPFPLGGFGWDAHLVFPALALMALPTLQIAQSTAALLVGELGKPYVVAARSVGHSWRGIRRHVALRNVIAPIVLIIAGSFRLLFVELVLVEWLFRWPGIGKLLATTLLPPASASAFSSDIGGVFLDPPLVATVVTVFAAVFLLTDLVASSVARLADPRLRAAESAHE